VGRQTSFTQEVADVICDKLSEGVTLREICRAPGMPNWRTVYDWIDADAEFGARIARAREVGADAIANEALHIADTPLTGEERVTKADGSTEVREGDMLGHRKLQVETRLKLLAKWSPKKYGDRLDVNAQVQGTFTVLSGVPRADA